jgi:hypothetical protein
VNAAVVEIAHAIEHGHLRPEPSNLERLEAELREGRVCTCEPDAW